MQEEPITSMTTPPASSHSSAFVRGAVLLALTVAVLAALTMGASCSTAWSAVQNNLSEWQDWSAKYTLLALVMFFLVHAFASSRPLPVLTVMTLLAGALFGRTAGTAVAALAYTAGVTAAFLAARWLFRDRLSRYVGSWLQPIERGIARDGAYYLLTLRLLPSVPFFLVNVLMARTPIRTRTYTLVSAVSVLPMTFLYASVGTDLMAIDSPSDVFSLPTLASLVALAVLPLAVRKLLRRSSTESLESGTPA